MAEQESLFSVQVNTPVARYRSGFVSSQAVMVSATADRSRGHMDQHFHLPELYVETNGIVGAFARKTAAPMPLQFPKAADLPVKSTMPLAGISERPSDVLSDYLETPPPARDEGLRLCFSGLQLPDVQDYLSSIMGKDLPQHEAAVLLGACLDRTVELCTASSSTDEALATTK